MQPTPRFLPGSPMDRIWWAIVHRVTKHWIQPKELSTHLHDDKGPKDKMHSARAVCGCGGFLASMCLPVQKNLNPLL